MSASQLKEAIAWLRVLDQEPSNRAHIIILRTFGNTIDALELAVGALERIDSLEIHPAQAENVLADIAKILGA